jgi:hypothetical protein
MTAKKATLVGNFHRSIAATAVGSLGCALTRRGQDEREQPRALLAAFRAGVTLPKRSDRSTATLACRWLTKHIVSDYLRDRGYLPKAAA